MIQVDGVDRNTKILAARTCLSVYENLNQRSNIDFTTHVNYLHAGNKLAVALMTAATLGFGALAYDNVRREAPSVPASIAFGLLTAGAAMAGRKAFQCVKFTRAVLDAIEYKGEAFARNKIEKTAASPLRLL